MTYFYTYKITFVDGHYYFGSRKSKVEPKDDIYWGSPKTHKEKWNTTMFCKEILNVFENGKRMMNEETELIGDLYKTDPLCLNQHNNANFSSLGMTYSDKSRQKMSEKKKGLTTWNKGIPHKEETKRKWSEKRKGVIHSSKISVDDVKRIRKMFEDRPPLHNVGKTMLNGIKLSYERAFANTFHSMFNITSINLYNIVTKRSWINV